MKISQLIKKLEKIKDKHGDLQLLTWSKNRFVPNYIKANIDVKIRNLKTGPFIEIEIYQKD